MTVGGTDMPDTPKREYEYVVEAKEIHRTFYPIKSETPLDREALLERAKEMMAEGGPDDLELEYDHTMEPEHWITRTKKGDYVK